MKTAKIPMYGNIEVYRHIALYVFKIVYTLRCLEHMCSVFSPLRRHGLLIMNILTNVLYYIAFLRLLER